MTLYVSKISFIPIKKLETPCNRNIQTHSYVLKPLQNFAYNIPKKSHAINKATIILPNARDIELKPTKNKGFIVDTKTNTELIYGKPAIDYLNKTSVFDCDTQITFPKNTSGTFCIDNQIIDVKEDSTVLISAGTKAKVNIKMGYPHILKTQKTLPWYKKHSSDELCLKDKFNDLIRLNSHTYNGEFKSTIFSNDNDVNNTLINKLNNNNLINQEKNGYFKFKKYPTWDYLKTSLNDFSDAELNILEPIYKQLRQTKLDTKLTLKTDADLLPLETINKLKQNNILFNNKEHLDKIFWKTNFESENHLREVLTSKNILGNEQDKIIAAWNKNNKIGYDITGLKFINDNAAIYSLEDKVNNMNMSKSCWITNSTALASTKEAATIGTSTVNIETQEPIAMSKIRKDEKLHVHPKLEGKSQTEIYLVTSGAAALTIVKKGIPQIKILKEGEVAIIPPKTPHCVNSVMGKYEQIVSQIPSVFQYGPVFKQNYNLSEQVQQNLENQAKVELMNIK
jgi:mannose-6-phosphate isomerase-like protein (cupin superfamily)